MSSPDPEMHPIHSRIVRFDSECILIPETHPYHRSRLPFIVTKSVALPLWKKKQHHLPSSDHDPPPDDAADRAIFRVPVPSFKAAKSRSPTRTRTVDADCIQPLHSCLVHRESSAPPLTRVVRQTSLPLPFQNVLTVPLRACCPDCVHITEECLKEGDNWQEKFSSGARRRRSASLDHDAAPRLFTLCPTAVSEGRIPTVPFSSRLTITVDEIDRKRKSTDFLDGIPQEFLSETTNSNAHHHIRDSSSSSGASAGSSSYFSDDIKLPSQKAPRIVEEDEDELFPLPSPRRTPINSPKVSPSHSPGTSPLSSPSGSTASLRHSLSSPSNSPASASDDSLASAKPNNKRRNRDERGMLTPDASPNVPHHSPSYSSPLHCEIHQTSLPTPESSPVQPAPTTTTTNDPGKLSFPSRRNTSSSNHSIHNATHHQPATHIRTVSSPVISTSLSAIRKTLIPPPALPTSILPPQTTPSSSSSTSPRSPTRKLRTSFSLLKVGADVLKGVSSIVGAPS